MRVSPAVGDAWLVCRLQIDQQKLRTAYGRTDAPGHGPRLRVAILATVGTLPTYPTVVCRCNGGTPGRQRPPLACGLRTRESRALGWTLLRHRPWAPAPGPRPGVASGTRTVGSTYLLHVPYQTYQLATRQLRLLVITSYLLILCSTSLEHPVYNIILDYVRRSQLESGD